MRPLLTFLICCLVAPLSAQQDPEDDWRLPFRSPSQEDLDPPADVYRELREMLTIAKRRDTKKFFNDDGIEICEDKAWQAARDRLISLPRIDAGYLSQIIRLSARERDRELALYGMYYIPDPTIVMQLINHIPGEPLLTLRQDAYPRAMAYLRVHYPKVNEGDLEEWMMLKVGPAGQKPPKPGEFTHNFDSYPYFMLLNIDNPIDQRQALWFLGEVVKLRPSQWKTYLGAAGPPLYNLIVSDDRTVRQAVVTFLELLDPEKRPTPSIDDSEKALKAYIDAIMYDVFPPIRPISPGLTDLHPSEELDRLVEVGRKILGDGSFGDATHGKLDNGSYYRGLEVKKVPSPVDKLGIEPGWIVTAVNGVPVTTCEELLTLLKKMMPKGKPHHRKFLVEFVWKGKLHAKEFRRAD